MSINQNKIKNKSYFMSLALNQAKKNLGNTKDNPSVGCVITKNNNLISAGSTGIGGRPHAETNAMLFKKNKVKNASLFVTLEPCSNYGKTSPCVDKIIKNKIKNVFFSIKDPDKRSFGKSLNTLRNKKIHVDHGINFYENNNFYKSYIKSKKKELPFLTIKLAVSKDFFTINKNEKFITNKYSRARVHLLRSQYDCILSTSNTIIKDNPRLDVRIDGLEKYSPFRVILDKNLIIPLKSKIFNGSLRNKTIIFYNKIKHNKLKSLRRLKIKSYKISLDEYSQIHLKKALIKIKQLGYTRVFTESGLKLTNSLLEQKLVDDFKLFISNRKLKKRGLANFAKYFNLFLRRRKNYSEKVNLFGDKFLTYIIK